MFTFPICHFSPPPATVSFVGTAEYVNNSSTITYTNAPIGTAGNDRWVLMFVHTGVNAGGYQPSSYTCTIGGITATKIQERITNYGSGASFIAKVPSGTTATCVANGNATGLFYPVGSVYVLRNLISATPYHSAIVSDTNAVKSTTINVLAGGVVIADSGGWTNVSSSHSWTGTAGLTEVYDSNPDGLNDMRISGAVKEFSSDGSSLGVTDTSSTSYIATSIADLMVLSFR
jgi:hypothetical protein